MSGHLSMLCKGCMVGGFNAATMQLIDQWHEPDRRDKYCRRCTEYKKDDGSPGDGVRKIQCDRMRCIRDVISCSSRTCQLIEAVVALPDGRAFMSIWSAGSEETQERMWGEPVWLKDQLRLCRERERKF